MQDIFKQKIFTFTVNNETIEAVANARLSFRIKYQGKNNNIKINLKQALKKTFLNQTIDPHRTKVKQRIVSELGKKTYPEKPEVKLTQTRILSLLEMKEWARNEIRLLASLKMMKLLVSYPLHLNKEYTAFAKEKNWKMAANTCGISFAYMSKIDTDNKKIKYFTKGSHPDYLKGAYDDNIKLLAELQKIKAAIKKEAIAYTIAYIEK